MATQYSKIALQIVNSINSNQSLNPITEWNKFAKNILKIPI